MTDLAKYPTEEWAETDPIEVAGERRAWWRDCRLAGYGRVAIVVAPDGTELLEATFGSRVTVIPADIVRKVLG